MFLIYNSDIYIPENSWDSQSKQMEIYYKQSINLKQFSV